MDQGHAATQQLVLCLRQNSKLHKDINSFVKITIALRQSKSISTLLLEIGKLLMHVMEKSIESVNTITNTIRNRIIVISRNSTHKIERVLTRYIITITFTILYWKACTMKIKSTKIVGTPIVRNSFCSKMWQIMDMQVIIISIQKHNL